MSDYFEAVIQLRPAREDVVLLVHQLVEQRKDVFIAKEVPVSTGLDIYISSQRYARSIGQQLKRRFKGTLIITKKLYGVNRLTSKQVYRGTVLFRLS